MAKLGQIEKARLSRSYKCKYDREPTSLCPKQKMEMSGKAY